MVIGLALLIALLGVLMYALSANGKIAELGRIMFFAGLFAFLMHADQAFTLLRR